MLTYREALPEDIPQIQIVRNAVKENTLSNPDLVTNADCLEYLTQRGKGWVCIDRDIVVGFSIVDLKDHNVWALFLLPEYEGRGIGQQLQELLLHWYFNTTITTLWLGTSPGTRAETFYRKSGWQEVGTHGKGEIKFEMTHQDYNRIFN